MPDLLSEITHAARAYYQQLAAVTLTETDFQEWLRELPVSARVAVATSGFATACTRRDFQRFCLEWRGFAMQEFMSRHLSVEAFALWQQNRQFNGDLPDNL